MFIRKKNKTANINVQNSSLYTCYRRHLRTYTSKTAKIKKGDIIQQHIDTQSMRCGQYHLFMIFAVFDV